MLCQVTAHDPLTEPLNVDADLTVTRGKNFSHAAIKNKVLAKTLKLTEDKMKNVIKMVVLSGFFVIGFYGSAFSDSIHPMLYSELSFHDAYRYQHNAKESSNAVIVASRPSVGHAHTGVSALSFHDAYRYTNRCNNTASAGNEPATENVNNLVCSK